MLLVCSLQPTQSLFPNDLVSGTVLSNRVSGEDAAYTKTKQGCLENMDAMSVGGIDHLDMSKYPCLFSTLFNSSSELTRI